ncbi:MAG: S-layer homology domain-containing protein [Candidatus Peribacteria bacterium]|nr:MAG: S-layer homology domain-containing protein [Candidatus Peribacteria bacterium]
MQGISHWGELLTNEFFAGIFQRDPAVQRSYVAQTEEETLVASLPCDISFVDVASDKAGQAVDLLGDLCIVGGMGGAKFYPQNHIRRGSVAKMVAGAMMYAYQGSATIETDGTVVYTDVHGPLVPYLVQLDQRGLLDEIARDEEVFGVNDVLTREEITSFLEVALASLPDTIAINTTIPLPLESEYVERQMFAAMLVDALQLNARVGTSVLAMQ